MENYLALLDYNIISTTHQSSFGQSIMLKHKTNNKNYMCKVISRNQMNQDDIDKFYRFLHKVKEFSAQYIVPFDTIIEEEGSIFLIRPFIDGISLKTYIERKLTQNPNVLYVFWKIINRVYHSLHQQGLFPNYIRPSNVFLGEFNKITITDLYLPPSDPCACFKQQNAFNYAFLSPEFFTKPESMSTASDIWSLGMLLFYMLTGEMPWGNISNILRMIPCIVEFNQELLKNHKGIPPSILQILQSALRIDPAKRQTIEYFLSTFPKEDRIKILNLSIQKEISVPKKMNLTKLGVINLPTKRKSILLGNFKGFKSCPTPPTTFKERTTPQKLESDDI